MNLSLLTCLLLLAFVQNVVCFSSFTLNLQVDEVQCFYEKLEKEDRLELSFQVSSGGSLDIDFVVKDPFGKIIHSVNAGSQTSFGFDSPTSGSFEYCFSNRRPRSGEDKVVTFVARGPDEKSKLETKYKMDDCESLFLASDLNSTWFSYSFTHHHFKKPHMNRWKKK